MIMGSLLCVSVMANFNQQSGASGSDNDFTLLGWFGSADDFSQDILMTDIISSNGATLGDVMSDLDNIHVNDESSSVPSSDLSLGVSGLSLDGALGGSGSVSLLSGMVTPGPLPDLGAGVGSLGGANAFPLSAGVDTNGLGGANALPGSVCAGGANAFPSSVATITSFTDTVSTALASCDLGGVISGAALDVAGSVDVVTSESDVVLVNRGGCEFRGRGGRGRNKLGRGRGGNRAKAVSKKTKFFEGSALSFSDADIRMVHSKDTLVKFVFELRTEVDRLNAHVFSLKACLRGLRRGFELDVRRASIEFDDVLRRHLDARFSAVTID